MQYDDFVTCSECGQTHDIDACWYEEDDSLTLFPVNRLCLPCWHEIEIEPLPAVEQPMRKPFVAADYSPDISHLTPQRLRYYFGREATPEQTERAIMEVKN